MPRHTQPREVAELKGATRKHPERYRKTPPAVDLPLGNAPDYFTPAQKGVWFELETYAPRGVLTGADRVAMELLSVLLDEFRTNPVEIRVAKIGQMVSCLGRLGMTPADRQKLGTEKPAEENPFNAF
jgi:hypothetical protein